MTADELISALLTLARDAPVCVLDSCAVGYLGSHLLIAGIEPVDVVEMSGEAPDQILDALEKKLTDHFASMFTLSYDLGRKLLNVHHDRNEHEGVAEPDLFVATFDVLITHDYLTGKTRLTGNKERSAAIADRLRQNISDLKFEISN